MGSCGDDPKVLLNIIGFIMVYQGAEDEGRLRGVVRDTQRPRYLSALSSRMLFRVQKILYVRGVPNPFLSLGKHNRYSMAVKVMHMVLQGTLLDTLDNIFVAWFDTVMLNMTWFLPPCLEASDEENHCRLNPCIVRCMMNSWNCRVCSSLSIRSMRRM